MNGTVHEEVITQQAPQQQQPPPPPPAQQHPYIAEPTAQSQFVQEAELSNGEQPQQQSENEPQAQTEERNEQPETEAFTASAQETEPEHQVSNTTVNSGPKTYATLVKSFSNATTGATSPQAPKLSMSPVSFVSRSIMICNEEDESISFPLQPPMTNLRLDDRSPLHPANNGPTSMSVSNNVSTVQQQAHRVGGNQPPQQQQHPQQQRVPRGGLVQRGKKYWELVQRGLIQRGPGKKKG